MKKKSLNESKDKLFRLMEVLNPDFKTAIRETDTLNQVIGKTVGQAFPDMKDKLWGIDDKTITYAKEFKSSGTFTAIHDAEKYLESEGYAKGSMYMDYPIGFIKNGKFGYDDPNDYPQTVDSSGNVIPNEFPPSSLMPTKHGEQRPMSMTKWDRLGSQQHDMLDGVILSRDFREGDAYVVFFVFPD